MPGPHSDIRLVKGDEVTFHRNPNIDKSLPFMEGIITGSGCTLTNVFTDTDSWTLIDTLELEELKRKAKLMQEISKLIFQSAPS